LDINNSTRTETALSDNSPSTERNGSQAGPCIVHLEPERPPGRCTRKALSYSDEIGRLHAAGYTLQAIRQALAKVGVNVSRSTVHREVRKARDQHAVRPSEGIARPHMDQIAQAPSDVSVVTLPGAASPARPAPSPAPDPPAQCSLAGGLRGEEVARAYMATQITNPFLRRKEQG
jgi:predicted DNA-binding protein (UPF0251 family)